MNTFNKNYNKRCKNTVIVKAIYGERAFDIAEISGETVIEEIDENFSSYEEWCAGCQRITNIIVCALVNRARIEFARQQPKDNIGRRAFYRKYAPARTRVRRALKNELIKILCNRLHNVIIKDVEFYISQITSEGLMYYNGYIYSITRKCWIK